MADKDFLDTTAALSGRRPAAPPEERALYVHGLGHFHPENVIDNRFLEDLDIGTSEAWIVERTGIERRRTVLPLDFIRTTRNADLRATREAALYDNAQTAEKAARMALERAGLSPSDIGMVVSGGCVPDACIPADACRIAALLGIEAPAFDLNSACSSFGAQLHLLAGMTHLPAFVLVVNPENTTRVIDYRDRSSAVLWGDGTSAIIVSRTVPSRVVLRDTALASNPGGWRAVQIPAHAHFTQEGSQVQRFAIKTTSDCVTRLLPAARARVEHTGGELRFIGHQANLLMLQAALRRSGIEGVCHWHNVGQFGNTGAAGAPSVLSQHWSDLGAGDSVLLAVVGSGLTWASLRIDIDP